MLVLSRRLNQTILIGDPPFAVVKIYELGRRKVKIGIEADPSIRVDRLEIHELRRRRGERQ